MPINGTTINDVSFFEKIINIQYQLMVADFNLENFMHLAVEKMQELTPATGVVIELVEGDDMVYRAAIGTVANYVGLRLPINNSISGLCVNQRKILYAEDTEIDPRVNKEACRKIDARSLVVGPLYHAGRAIGVLKIVSKQPKAFSEQDMQTLVIMAGFIASGIEHQTYYQQIHVLLDEKTKALDELKKSEYIKSKLASIVEFSDDAIIGRSLDGLIESWNKGAEKLYGFTEKEMLGASVARLYPPNRIHEFYHAIKEVNEGRQVDSFNTERMHKDGHLIPVSVMISPIKNENGEIIGSCSIARDITELKKLINLKDEFVSTVSHELRTPLTSIQGSLGLVISGVCGAIPERAAKLLTICKQNSDRLTYLINDILDIQKIESGKMIFHLNIHNMQKIIHDTVQATAAYADKYNKKIIIKANESAAVKVDNDRIIQVLSNFISNAIKFSSTNDIVINSKVINGSVKVEVTNKGTGIPSESRSKIFQKFSQLENAKTLIKGTGLGLSISKEIIEKHGGSIGFESIPHEDTTFFFELPVSDT